MADEDAARARFTDIVHMMDEDVPDFDSILAADRRVLEITDFEGKNLLIIGLECHCSTDKIQAMLTLKPELAEAHHMHQLPFHYLIDQQMRGWDLGNAVAIFRAYPKVASLNDLHGSINGWPLHKVATKQAFPELLADLVSDLLHHYPQAVYEKSGGELPLHRFLIEGAAPPRVVIAVLAAYLGAAAVPTTQGLLALHICVQKKQEIEVVRQVIEAYPTALVEEIKVSGRTCLEHALFGTSDVSRNMINTLMNGGTGDNAVCIAYARASMFGLFTRNRSLGYVRPVEVEPEDSYDFAKMRANRRRLRFQVVCWVDFELEVSGPEARVRSAKQSGHTQYGEQFEVEMMNTATAEDLMFMLQDREGSPPALQKICFNGRRMLPSDKLANFITKREDVVYLKSSYDLFHQMIRHGTDKDTLLHMLAVRPKLATEDDHLGLPPLQLALERGADEEVLLELLRLSPVGVRTEVAHTAAGENLIRIALTRGAKVSFFRKLLESVRPEDWNELGHFSPDGDDHVDGSGEEPHYPPMLHTVFENKRPPETAKLLLDSGYPVHTRDPMHGSTALECALLHGVDEPTFILLFSASVQVDPEFHCQRGASGRTPMHFAVANGSTSAKIIRMLCDYGGGHELLLRDTSGRLPIHLAVLHSISFDALRELITASPETIHEVDGQGRTPLQIAVCGKPQPGVIFELSRLDPRALHVRDTRGRSVLHLAVLADVPLATIHELLELNADMIEEVNLVNEQWPTNAAGREVRRLALQPRMELRNSADLPCIRHHLAHHHHGAALQQAAERDAILMRQRRGAKPPREEPDEGWQTSFMSMFKGMW